jgi:hypothetical protein
MAHTNFPKVTAQQQSNHVSCPKCGSSHITLFNQANVSWGRAVTGWILFGPIGAAVGAVTGNDRTSNVCLNCGESWKASDLYIVLQTIRTLLNVDLNLSKNDHRDYLSVFFMDVAPHISRIEETKKNGEKRILAASSESPSASECSTWVVYAGGIGFIIGFITGAITGWTQGNLFAPLKSGFMFALLVYMIAYFLDVLTGGSRRSLQRSKQAIQEKIQYEKAEAIRQLEVANLTLERQIAQFRASHVLHVEQ